MKWDVHFFSSAKYAKWMIISLIIFFSSLTLIECSKYFFLSLEVAPSEPSVSDLAVSAQNNSFDAILPASLFGVYVSNDLTSANVKKSMLNVTIVGILWGNTTGQSQVIIRSANGEEKNYAVDESLPGGALIKKIMADGVLVQRDGELESLSLPKDTLSFDPAAAPLPTNEE